MCVTTNPGLKCWVSFKAHKNGASAESIRVCHMNVENATVVVGGIHCRDRKPGVITYKCSVGVLWYRV